MIIITNKTSLHIKKVLIGKYCVIPFLLNKQILKECLNDLSITSCHDIKC